MIMTNGTYPWSFVTQLFCNGYPGHDSDRKTFEGTTSTYPLGTIDSVAGNLTTKMEYYLSVYPIFQSLWFIS
jgi:hypothetical protein